MRVSLALIGFRIEIYDLLTALLKVSEQKEK